MEVIDNNDARAALNLRASEPVQGIIKDFVDRRTLMIYCITGTAVVLLIAYLLFIDTDKPVVIIEGSSMVPNINNGDIVLLHKEHLSQLRIGDIIAFNKQRTDGYGPTNPIVVHRIVEKEIGKDGSILLITRGDFNLENDDDLTNEKNYVGKVYSIIPKAGFVAKGLQNPVILGLMLALIVGITFLTLRRRI